MLRCIRSCKLCPNHPHSLQLIIMSIRITQQLQLISFIEEFSADSQYLELLSLTPQAIHLHMNTPETSDEFINLLNLIATYINLRYRADNRPFAVYLNNREV